MSWFYDVDGERIVDFSAWYAAPSRHGPLRPRGKPLHACFVSRQPEYPAESAAVLPGDARAAIDRARALHWNGARTLWLLPACGLERPDLVLSTPSRLRAWAGASRLYELSVYDPALAGSLAADLGVPAVPAAEGAAEAQWRDGRWFVLRCRFGVSVSIYCRSPADLVVALDVATRRAPRVGLWVQALRAPIRGPSVNEVPESTVPPPGSWAALPGAKRHRGPRDVDVIWVLPDPDGIHIEAYNHHHDAPDRLWTWITIRGDTAVEHRFRR
jgi:hypothetical protein